MKIELQRLSAKASSVPSAKVRLTIASQTAPVELNGIIVKEPRPGWVALDLPPLEAWEKSLRWLTPEQRERIESAEFYQLLQHHVTKQFLAGRPAPG